MKKQCIKYAAILLIFSVTMVGCAAMEKGTVESDEKMLSTAGFKMKPADTPGKIAHVQSMQQRKIITHEKNGIVYYAYADAEFCKCLYMGTQKNYAEYSKLRIQQSTAEMNETANMDWGPWGGWGMGWGGFMGP